MGAQSLSRWTTREVPECVFIWLMPVNIYPAAAAVAAKSLQSCPTLCDPIDSSPPGSPIPGILQARTLEWVAISFSSVLAWRIPGTGVTGGLLSMGSHRVGHD